MKLKDFEAQFGPACEGSGVSLQTISKDGAQNKGYYQNLRGQISAHCYSCGVRFHEIVACLRHDHNLAGKHRDRECPRARIPNHRV
mgnify:CR=1 FL=1